MVAPTQSPSLSPPFSQTKSALKKDPADITLDTTLKLNEEKLKRDGILEYRDLKGYNRDGISITEFKSYSPENLIKFRYLRRLATTGAVGFSLWSIYELIKSASKLIISTLGNGDVDEAYQNLGKAYSKSSIAGGLTGIANESSFWAIGNLGMGLFSWLGLDKLQWLSGFSIADGLAAIGMGQVRYRDEQNAFAVKHSLFNNPRFSKFRFLIPVEQSILSFINRFRTLDGWKRFNNEEPYSLFQTAGGGLVAGGGILGIASLFKNKMSETMQSFAYIPYSFFSLVNLIALFRDGQKVNERAKDFGGRKLSESYSMKVEGYCKQVAAPILGLNNFLLALKGAGADSQGGTLYNLAMATRAIGAASAFLGFTAQSALKFFKPDLFGPYTKYKGYAKMNPHIAKEITFHEAKTHQPLPHNSDKFLSVLEQDKNHEILKLILDDEEFKILEKRSQAGLPTKLAPGRAHLQRYTHSLRVCSIGITLFDTLLKNTTDKEIKDFLIKNETAFKAACLLHDIGHIGRSHLAEKAIKGHLNDELTMDILKGKFLKIKEKLMKFYTEKYDKNYADELLSNMQEIIGHKSPLSKLLKIADFIEYVRSRGGDFNSADHERFPEWSIEKMVDYGDTIRLVRGEKSKPELCYTWKGAKETLNILFDRLRFNALYNNDPIIVLQELLYVLGVDAEDIAACEAREMAEKELDKRAEKGAEKLNGCFKFIIKTIFGGEGSYTGLNKRNRFKVLDENLSSAADVLDYYHTEVKKNSPQDYTELAPKIHALTTPQELELIIEIAGT